MNWEDDPPTMVRSVDRALDELADVQAQFDQAELEVAVLAPTAMSERLRQILSGVRWALGSRDVAQAPRRRQMARLRRVVADVRADARRQSVLDSNLVATTNRLDAASAAATVGERRRDARATVRAPVIITPWDPLCTWLGIATTLSIGGVFVSTTCALAPGSRIAVRVRPPEWEEEAVLAGVVQRACIDGIAVRFLDSGLGQDAIQAIMVARRGMPLTPWFIRR